MEGMTATESPIWLEQRTLEISQKVPTKSSNMGTIPQAYKVSSYKMVTV
jgi:hypothetical protein